MPIGDSINVDKEGCLIIFYLDDFMAAARRFSARMRGAFLRVCISIIAISTKAK
jgi:hypothetical protein